MCCFSTHWGCGCILGWLPTYIFFLSFFFFKIKIDREKLPWVGVSGDFSKLLYDVFGNHLGLKYDTIAKMAYATNAGSVWRTDLYKDHVHGSLTPIKQHAWRWIKAKVLGSGRKMKTNLTQLPSYLHFVEIGQAATAYWLLSSWIQILMYIQGSSAYSFITAHTQARYLAHNFSPSL